MLKKLTKQQKEKLVGVVTIVLVAIVGLMLVSSRISSSRSISPNAPESKAEAANEVKTISCDERTKCPGMHKCINGRCALPNQADLDKKNIQNKSRFSSFMQKIFPKKSGNIRAE